MSNSTPKPKEPRAAAELPQQAGTVPLDQLVEQLLVGRLDGLDGPGVAAFIAGWSSALDLVRRTDLSLPDASPEVAQAIEQLVRAIEHAQRAVVADSDDGTP